MIALFVTMLTWPVGPLVRVKRFCEQEVVPLFAKSNWSELALISLSAGVGEEMLFRGVFQASFTEWWGLAWGLVLASMLFGFLHPISLPYIVIADVPRLLFRRGLVLERQSLDGHRDPHPL